MTPSTAAEYLRTFAAGGTPLHECLEEARRQAPGVSDRAVARVNAAEQVLRSAGVLHGS